MAQKTNDNLEMMMPGCDFLFGYGDVSLLGMGLEFFP
jgi:hypothetical protein